MKNFDKSTVSAHNLGQIGAKRDRATEACSLHTARSDGEAEPHGVARKATSDDCPDGQCRSRMRRQDGLKCGHLPFLLFCGPCVLESGDLAQEVAGFLKEALGPLSPRVQLTFKGSFDKANRSSLDSFRGPGLERGLAILEEVKGQTGLPVLTDFHLPEQAEAVAAVCDVLQVPAFLCRQTDLVVAGAKACQRYGRTLKIKKGQFMAPEEMGNVVAKVSPFLPAEQLLLTERGSCFGYNNLVVDMASFQIMQSFGVRAIHDATHCVQRPGGLGKTTGGKRQQIATLARAAVAAGADGVFMEAHPNPPQAKSDASTCLKLEGVRPLVEELLRIFEVVSGEGGSV